MSFAIKETNKHLKIFYIVSLFLFLFTILISGTRAAYLGIFIGALYFLLFYPKKFKLLKTCVGLFLILIFLIVLYANIHPQLPTILQNRITKDVVTSLSIKNASHDERFRAWQTVLQEIEDKPILGWGPENMSVGFDKNYDPRVISSLWWDRAHNIFLDTGAQAGILGIITYILLFIILFWSLQKIKPKKEHNTQIIITGIQAALIGYLMANFFSFDTLGTYLIFFLLIAYSMHLIYGTDVQNETQNLTQKKSFWKPAFISVLFIILLIFLWQYNLVPLQINAELNRAKNLSDQKQCDQAFVLLDKTLQEHSFVDSYAIMKYVDFEKTCAGFYPQNNLTYINKGLEFMNEAVKIQPLYTRYWLNMGELTTVLAGQQEDNLDLIKRANSYFDKALELAPKHQEIYIAKIKLDITDTDYKNAENHSYKCIDLNPALADCYWYKGVSEIYLKNYKDAQNNIQLAKEKKYNVNSQTSLIELANAYGFIPDYKNLADVFEKIVAINPNVAQYHSL
ncbi:MAG: O-antigen ligase family protein, partial [Candidatus Staskawiczbacteria bacterium]|nr:O-antigen ligase family protein [Candidatus Staskawiczbacteria bacterium]